MADYPRNSQKRKAQPVAETSAVESALLMAWNLLKALFGKKGGADSGGRAAKLKALGESWGSVEMHLMQSTTLALAVSEGDKILDSALKVKGLAGETMGDRLKSASGLFEQSLYQRIWDAHKLRNVLAHEVGASVNPEEAKRAVAAFREALYKLGVL